MTVSKYRTFNRIRLRLEIPTSYCQEPIVSRLISEFDLVVNITGAMLTRNSNSYGYCDLELQGTPQQISRGLMYLKSLSIRMMGKPNVTEDDWYY